VYSVKTHTFNRRRYRVRHDHVLEGYAEVPGKALPEIYISAAMKGHLSHLDTAIHEALHVEYPMLSEKLVERGGKEIARFLWRLGYRLKEDEK